MQIQPFRWTPLPKEIRGQFRIVQKQTLPYALMLISNWQTPQAKAALPGQEINCLMTVKDIGALENIDEHILCDWLI